MNKIALNKYRDTYYFKWDNKDETIEMVNEYLKTTKGHNWSCLRCWDEETNSNTSDVLCISEKFGTSTSNSFYQIGEYVIDTKRSFWGYNEEEFKRGDWKETISKCV